MGHFETCYHTNRVVKGGHLHISPDLGQASFVTCVFRVGVGRTNVGYKGQDPFH